jgi:cytidylate kinase
MIIAISGLSGSGKNTLGKKLAKKLGYRLVCPTFKDLAKNEEISLLEFQAKAEADPDIDRKFDDHLKKEASAGNCVVTTWLGPWMVEPDIRIWVFVPDEIRAQRLAKRDGISVDKALEHIRVRDNNNRNRYKTVYGIDIDDHSSFDICLNSGIYSPEELVEISMGLINTNTKNKGDS